MLSLKTRIQNTIKKYRIASSCIHKRKINAEYIIPVPHMLLVMLKLLSCLLHLSTAETLLFSHKLYS